MRVCVFVSQIARILSEMPAFQWMGPLIDKHIAHPYQEQMARKSIVSPLPIQNKNEAKYDDVLDIMDQNEVILQRLFRDAHGKYYNDKILVSTIALYH